MPANLKNSAVATGLEKVSFHYNPKKGNAKKCSNYCTIALISHASKVMLKILQASAVKKSTNNKCWRGCGEKGKPLTLLVGMQLVQAL